MREQMSTQETQLIREYRGSAGTPRASGTILDYARLLRISEGRAEDALDLWLHLFKSAQYPN